MTLVSHRKANNVSTEQLTDFRSHAWFIASSENTFHKHINSRLVLNLLESIAVLH